MPDEVEAAVALATRDEQVKVIVLRGAGRAFCAGYDFGGGFKHWGDALETDGRWDPGKDFVMATAPQLSPTQKLASVWRCPKPVIAQVHGWCVGGGSDFALCADLVIASEDAVIGTPYSRMWGAYAVRDVDLPARAGEGEGARADRAAADGRRGGGRRADQPGGAVRRARGRGRRAGRRARAASRRRSSPR